MNKILLVITAICMFALEAHINSVDTRICAQEVKACQ